MIDFKKRNKRRDLHFETKLSDSKQLLRVSGQGCVIHANSSTGRNDQGEIMIPSPIDGVTVIDRFDGRSLLDYIPRSLNSKKSTAESLQENGLNFERYKDLVENHRLKAVESQFLEAKNLNWHQFGKVKAPAGARISYSYDGSTNAPEKQDVLSSAADLTTVANQLTPSDLAHLNSIASSYGIKNYSQLLFSGNNIYASSQIKNKRHSEEESEEPTNNEVTIEFTGEQPIQVETTNSPTLNSPKITKKLKTEKTEKKLTPLEKMRLKVQQGLNQSIRQEKEQLTLKQQSLDKEHLINRITRPQPQNPYGDQTTSYSSNFNILSTELERSGMSNNLTDIAPNPQNPDNANIYDLYASYSYYTVSKKP